MNIKKSSIGQWQHWRHTVLSLLVLVVAVYFGLAGSSSKADDNKFKDKRIIANHGICCGGDSCGGQIHVPGRMTGGGSIFTSDGMRVTHGFELYCSPDEGPNNLEVNFGNGNHFHLDSVQSSYCYLDPNINAENPTAPINTLVLIGTGSLNGVPGATIGVIFTDAGEPGNNDTAVYTIIDANGNTVLDTSGRLTFGNHQAHKLQPNR